jgi:hypothetical protein
VAWITKELYLQTINGRNIQCILRLAGCFTFCLIKGEIISNSSVEILSTKS